jgi:hypothetical protein
MSTSRMRSTRNSNPEVDRWFGVLDHPLKEAMLLARQIILDADQRMSESIKWSSPTFAFKGNLASFQPKAKQFVSLMFHRGSEIPGDHPRLEGDAPLVRIMRFRNEADVEARRSELQAVVRAWCDWRAGGGET